MPTHTAASGHPDGTATRLPDVATHGATNTVVFPAIRYALLSLYDEDAPRDSTQLCVCMDGNQKVSMLHLQKNNK